MKRVLITGGSGFLGRRLATLLRDSYEPVLASRNHSANRHAEIATGCRSVPLDVTNIESVRDVIADVEPGLVVHAAATKYVGLAELHPMECIDVNVRGSQNVARVAVETNVEAVIGVSTDKAASPNAGTYALSKALMERAFCGMHGKRGTEFSCVRLGNIAWSTGSVLPEWREMSRDPGVITSTGPNMSRFFISADEAAAEVRSALETRDQLGGRVLVRPMRATKISDLLEVWTAVFGNRWTVGERRVGDRDREWLVSPAESSHTQMTEVAGRPGYVISFTTPPVKYAVAEISSETAPRFTRPELEALLRAAPDG
ncbi:polysaccharide biosynthesis protein [Solirubrobacter soli]|uniref:polysaccharide biosynthesis protein n=1 Tax=Solirubrobacter soli TaxID=363832 RepID=UPI0004825E80|nr:polysaccharide biosynthesis protein [Solirubrobacter soli]